MNHKKKAYGNKVLTILCIVLLIGWMNPHSIRALTNTSVCIEETISLPSSTKTLSVSHKENEIKKRIDKTIVLDAGHGGYDEGSSANGYVEKDITLDFTKILGKKLEKQGYHVIYTRENDDWYWKNIRDDLQQRVNISEDADLFISIHLNDYGGEIKGVETWTSYSNSKSLSFAQIVQQKMADLNYSDDRGLKNQDDSPLYVLENNSAPSVLLELGFISSSDDMKYLSTQAGQELISDAIATSVHEYYTL